MIDDIRIEVMNETHLKDLALLEKQCFSVPWSENGLSAELTNETAHFLSAVSGEKVLGYIGIHEEPDYTNMTASDTVINGMTLFAERLDGVVVGTISLGE